MRGREQHGLQPGQCPPGCDRGPRATPCPQGPACHGSLYFCHSSVLGATPPSSRDIIGYVLHLRPVGGGCGWVERALSSEQGQGPGVPGTSPPLLLTADVLGESLSLSEPQSPP